MENPTAVPQATGSNIAAAGLLKRKLGRVKLGMYVVMVGLIVETAVRRQGGMRGANRGRDVVNFDVLLQPIKPRCLGCHELNSSPADPLAVFQRTRPVPSVLQPQRQPHYMIHAH